MPEVISNPCVFPFLSHVAFLVHETGLKKFTANTYLVLRQQSHYCKYVTVTSCRKLHIQIFIDICTESYNTHVLCNVWLNKLYTRQLEIWLESSQLYWMSISIFLTPWSGFCCARGVYTQRPQVRWYYNNTDSNSVMYEHALYLNDVMYTGVLWIILLNETVVVQPLISWS